MKIQVLVASMNQRDHDLLKKMNIQTNAIVGNQCDFNSVEAFEFNGNNVVYLNFAERGVGLNRNNALMRAKDDVCLIADDDMVYVDDYEKIIEKSFKKYPDADMFVYNLKSNKQSKYEIKKPHRVWYFNYLRYGTARIALKLDSVRKNGIYFNQNFGGGTDHCHGEDNIFLTDCLKKGLKIYAMPYFIAKLTDERDSTWDNGYNEKYIIDQGDLYRAISRRYWRLLCLQDAIRKSKKNYKMNWLSAYKLMCKNQ